MKITTVSYTATINLGDYESEKVEITAEVSNEDGSVGNVIDALRAHVETVTLRPGWLANAQHRVSKSVAPPKSVTPDPFANFTG